MKIYILYLLIIFSPCFPQGRVDGVAAIVGEYMILHSDVLQQSQFIALDRGVDPAKSPYLFEKIYFESLENLINQYVVLRVAEKDTNLVVSDEEIDRALNQQIDDFILRAGSEKLFLEMAGSSMRNIRKNYWKDIRDMMFVERYQYSKIQNVDVSRPEVVAFYESYKDSIPMYPDKYDYSIVEIPFSEGINSSNETLVFLSELKNKILNKEARFDSLAIIHSEDPGSSLKGGFLGFTKRGSLVKEYEQAVYSMEIGEISDPVKSSFGYHLIKLIDRQGEKVSTQHILRLTTFSKEDKDAVFSEMEEYFTKYKNNPEGFDSLAIVFSKKFKNGSGVFLNKTYSEIPNELHLLINKQKVGFLERPIKTEEGCFILFLYKHDASFKPDLKNSWDLIYQYAKQRKQSEVFSNYVDNIKKESFIKIFN